MSDKALMGLTSVFCRLATISVISFEKLQWNFLSDGTASEVLHCRSKTRETQLRQRQTQRETDRKNGSSVRVSQLRYIQHDNKDDSH